MSVGSAWLHAAPQLLCLHAPAASDSWGLLLEAAPGVLLREAVPPETWRDEGNLCKMQERSFNYTKSCIYSIPFER